MISQDQVDEINNSLLLKYGRFEDKPKYRLTWSTTAFEKRYVEGTEYFGPIKLRDVKGIQEMPKYPRSKDRWILEILIPIPEGLKDELVGDNGLTYEPLFTFDKKGLYLDPNWMIVNLLAYLSTNPVLETISPEHELYTMDKNDYQKLMDILDNEMPDMAMKLKKGSAVSLGSKRFHLIN